LRSKRNRFGKEGEERGRTPKQADVIISYHRFQEKRREKGEGGPRKNQSNKSKDLKGCQAIQPAKFTTRGGNWYGSGMEKKPPFTKTRRERAGGPPKCQRPGTLVGSSDAFVFLKGHGKEGHAGV